MNKNDFILWTIGAALAASATASPIFTANGAPTIYVAMFAAVFLLTSPCLYWAGDKITFRFAKKKAADNGVQVRALKTFDALRQIDAIAFTRPQMLLEGRPLITDIVGMNGMEQDRLLTLAATIEEGAHHPVGRAIYYAAAKRGLTDLFRRSSFIETPFGAQANLNGTIFRVGDIAWVEEEFAMQIPAVMATRADQLAYHGKIPVIIVGGGITRGLIALKDDVNKMAVETIAMLNDMGFVTRFFGNEPKRLAASIERETGVPIQNGLRPLAMIREIQLMRAKGSFVAVVGTNKTEAEVYLAGDLSVLVGSPTKMLLTEEAAGENAPTTTAEDEPMTTDLVLRRDLYALIPTVKLSHTVKTVAAQNHGAALFAGICGALFSSGALVEFGVPLLPLTGAVAFFALILSLMWFNARRLLTV